MFSLVQYITAGFTAVNVQENHCDREAMADVVSLQGKHWHTKKNAYYEVLKGRD